MQRLFLTLVLSSLSCMSVALADSSRIVKIHNENGYGTGFLVEAYKNIYATNLHVCSKVYTKTHYSLSRIKLEDDQGNIYPARILEIDNRYDICLLTIEQRITKNSLELNDIELPTSTEMDILTLPAYGKRIHVLNTGRDYTNDPWMFTHRDTNTAEGLCKLGMSGSPVVLNDKVVGQVWGCSYKNTKAFYTPIINFVKNIFNVRQSRYSIIPCSITIEFWISQAYRIRHLS